MSPVIYRLMHPSELAAVCSLTRDVFDEFVGPQYGAEGVAEFVRFASVDAFSGREKSDHVTLVAEFDGELAGMLQLRERRHLVMLFVRSAHQRSGIGRGLLEAACAVAGDPDAAFTVNASPNAVAAYERLGFCATSAEQSLRGIRYVPMQRLPASGRTET